MNNNIKIENNIKIKNFKIKIENYSSERFELKNISMSQKNDIRDIVKDNMINPRGAQESVGIFERRIDNFDPSNYEMQIYIEDNNKESLNLTHNFPNPQMDNLKTTRTFDISKLKRGYQESFTFAIDQYFQLQGGLYTSCFILMIWYENNL